MLVVWKPLPEKQTSDDAHEETHEANDAHGPREADDWGKVKDQKREDDAANSAGCACDTDGKSSALAEPMTDSRNCRREQQAR